MATVQGTVARRSSGRAGRARLQLLVTGVLAAAALAGGIVVVHYLTGWPEPLVALAVLAATAVPLAVLAGADRRVLARSDRILAHAIVAVGLVATVTLVFLGVVVTIDGLPDAGDRPVTGRAMVAAATAALLAVAARGRIEAFANQRVYGTRRAPEDTLNTLTSRMTRAVPLDELLLQLAESLRRTMSLRSAEVWTGTGGTFERVAAVPDRPGAVLELDGEALRVASRSQVVGSAWLDVWIPDLLVGREGADVRAVSVIDRGELLGLIVVEGDPDDARHRDATDEDVLVRIGRQLGLALHNAKLDSALQASLAELRDRNAELVASRARIVAASDESRRRIERDLHDGAQQHLVALAVKVGLVRQLAPIDAERADRLLDELRVDIQTTLTLMRELAHGIYPPLLRDRGLTEALRTAANRSILPTTVEATDLGRYDPEVEAAVYFCCLEAMQNADKHAGGDATVRVGVKDHGGQLAFEVRDDGPGFDAAQASGRGSGFVNMADRLGAFGGTLEVTSSPGGGTSVQGQVPVAG